MNFADALMKITLEYRFSLVADVDPGDEETPGFIASVLIDEDDEDNCYFVGSWDKDPGQAIILLLKNLEEQKLL